MDGGPIKAHLPWVHILNGQLGVGLLLPGPDHPYCGPGAPQLITVNFHIDANLCFHQFACLFNGCSGIFTPDYLYHTNRHSYTYPWLKTDFTSIPWLQTITIYLTIQDHTPLSIILVKSSTYLGRSTHLLYVIVALAICRRE